MGKENIIDIQLDNLIEFIASASHALLVGGCRQEDILVSIPEYVTEFILHRHNTNFAGVHYLKEASHICGCKVQPGYENKIVVFNKHRHLTKEGYMTYELNQNID